VISKLDSVPGCGEIIREEENFIQLSFLPCRVSSVRGHHLVMVVGGLIIRLGFNLLSNFYFIYLFILISTYKYLTGLIPQFYFNNENEDFKKNL
jgi:hypothetical protein